jgi:hypothetical protein
LLAILLIALMSGVLGRIARLSLLSGVLDVAAALLDLMGIAGFGIAGTLVALIVRRTGGGLAIVDSVVLATGQRAVNARVSSIFRNRDLLDLLGDEPRSGPEPDLLMRCKIEGTGSKSRQPILTDL